MYIMPMNTETPEEDIASIEVDRPLCIGAASCMALAPETFELDAEAKAVVINPKGNSNQDTLLAAQSCPVKAIILKDKNHKIIWPQVE